MFPKTKTNCRQNFRPSSGRKDGPKPLNLSKIREWTRKRALESVKSAKLFLLSLALLRISLILLIKQSASAGYRLWLGRDALLTKNTWLLNKKFVFTVYVCSVKYHIQEQFTVHAFRKFDSVQRRLLAILQCTVRRRLLAILTVYSTEEVSSNFNSVQYGGGF